MFRSSDPTKLAEWGERLERFSSCGLAVARFCAQEHVSAASFYHWRKKLGHKGRHRRMTDGRPRHRTSLAGGRGLFQPVEVVPARQGAVRGAPAAPAARGFVPIVSGLVPAARAVCIQLPCGTRIEVGAGDLDAVRTVVAEVARAYRGREAGVA